MGLVLLVILKDINAPVSTRVADPVWPMSGCSRLELVEEIRRKPEDFGMVSNRNTEIKVIYCDSSRICGHHPRFWATRLCLVERAMT